MHRSRRVRNHGTLPRMVSKIRHSADVLVSGLTKHGILVCQRAKDHIFGAEAEPTLPPGRDIGDYREFVLGQDASFAWHHLQVWAEFYEARFQVPQRGKCGHLRLLRRSEIQVYAAVLRRDSLEPTTVQTISNGSAVTSTGVQTSRGSTSRQVIALRLTQMKLQYSFQHETTGPGQDNHLLGRRSLRSVSNHPLFRIHPCES